MHDLATAHAYSSAMSDAPHRAISLAIGGFIAMAAAMGIGRFVYTPILPFMAEGIGLTKPQAGLIASANFLGYLLGALAAASPFLPGGKRGWFIAGLAASALSTAAMGLVSTVPAFLLLRLTGGIASAFVLVFASALVLERLAAMERPGLSALHFAGVGAGIALSALMIGGLDAAGLDWRAQWLASGGLTLLALLAARAPGAARRGDAGSRTRRRRSRRERPSHDPPRPRLWVLRLRLCHHRHLHLDHCTRDAGAAGGRAAGLARRRPRRHTLRRLLGRGRPAARQ
jgi:MFS family permease